MTVYLGLDPGCGGGLAWLSDDGACAEKMPDTEREVFDLLSAICRMDAPGAKSVVAALEFVRSSPQMGVVSAFTFGRGYGFLRGCLTALDIPFIDVTPAKWQKALGCLSHKDKNVTKAAASRLFPTLRVTHSTADALLIATWCARQNWRGVA